MSETPRNQRRRIRWKWIGLTLIILVLIALLPLYVVGSTFLRYWNAPYSDWFVDANGQPVAGACEAAALLRTRYHSDVRLLDSLPTSTLSPEAVLRAGDQAVVLQFGLNKLPVDPVVRLIQTVASTFGNTSAIWLYIAPLPSDPASNTLVSEAAPHQKVAIVIINAFSSEARGEVIAVPASVPPETCRRELRTVLRTIVNEWRDRTVLMNFAAGWAYYVIVLVTIIATPILLYRGVRALRR